MLRFIDSFDHYDTNRIGNKYTLSNSGGSINAAGGRNGTDCLGLNHNQGWARRNIGAGSLQATWIVGAAIKESYRCSGHVIFGWMDSANTGGYQVEVRINAAGLLQVTRAGTVLATGGTTITVGVFYFIEFKVTINNATGTYEVRLNGAVEITGSGANTRGTTTNNGADILSLRDTVNTDNTNNQIVYDDLYVCDGTTATNNDYLGDCRVQTILPTAAGATTQWAPTPATNNYSRVNENPPDDDTSYVSDATVGDIDTYAMGDLVPVAGTVKGIQFVPTARKDDAGTRTIAPMLRIGGVNYAQPNLPNLTTTYQMIPEVVEVSPATTVAFTVAEVNAMEAGVKVIA